jgi:hypothetical protein
LYSYARYVYSESAPSQAGYNVWDCTTPESIMVVRYVYEMYKNMKTAMPALMAHRYQD